MGVFVCVFAHTGFLCWLAGWAAIHQFDQYGCCLNNLFWGHWSKFKCKVYFKCRCLVTFSLHHVIPMCVTLIDCKNSFCWWSTRICPSWLLTCITYVCFTYYPLQVVSQADKQRWKCTTQCTPWGPYIIRANIPCNRFYMSLNPILHPRSSGLPQCPLSLGLSLSLGHT